MNIPKKMGIKIPDQNIVKELVSKKKKRFIDEKNGFNLDLSYIGPHTRIIAMGYPAEGVESIYRNAMSEVQRFFQTYHKDNVKVYNLCSEKRYESEMEDFFDVCEKFGFDDHNPCPLALIRPFCESVNEWLLKDPKNFAAIHCKAGKGRTGMMISAYLVHSGLCPDAEHALQYFGEMRTWNNKGVTIPSQMRYVHYYEHVLQRGSVTPYPYQITHIRMVTVPSFDSIFDGNIMGGGCTPTFDVTLFWAETEKKDGEKTKYFQRSKVIYSYKDHVKKLRHYKKDQRFIDLDCSNHGLKVIGDVKIQFYEIKKGRYRTKDKEKMCYVWFNTSFVENNFLCFEKAVIDKACKDKRNARFNPNFKLEIFLHKISDVDASEE
mmetsp:Transcript_2369/g.3215  ORF Transcript_2369/g.3215 Transcript_2369/m.3215 type:complete len:377 (+) Transcript_2369:222-1352(+)